MKVRANQELNCDINYLQVIVNGGNRPSSISRNDP